MKKKYIYFTIGIVLLLAVISLIALNKPQIVTKPKEENKKVKNDLPQGEAVFYTTDNKEITRIIIELADDDYSRSFGLMFREILPFNQGMLFIFDDIIVRSFWMKNTPLSLDMIFVDQEKKIVKIHKGTKPFSLQSYSSITPARYVVEVNAGYTDSFQIKEGDKVDWKIY